MEEEIGRGKGRWKGGRTRWRREGVEIGMEVGRSEEEVERENRGAQEEWAGKGRGGKHGGRGVGRRSASVATVLLVWGLSALHQGQLLPDQRAPLPSAGSQLSPGRPQVLLATCSTSRPLVSLLLTHLLASPRIVLPLFS